MGIVRGGRPKPPEPLRRQQYEGLVLPQLDALYRVALRLTSNRQQAQDLVQETCLRAYRAFDSFDGQNGRAWLFTILRHTHVSHWRHDGHGAECVPYEDENRPPNSQSLPVDPSAEDIVLANLLAEDIEQALGALPVEARLLLLLAYVEELSYAEIAQVMDCPIGTVMSRLYRARHQMEELLAPTRIQQPEPNRE